MRSDGSLEPGIISCFDVADKVFGGGDLRFPFFRVFKIDKPMTECCANSRFIYGPGGIVHEKVHVVKCRGAGTDHLKAGKFCAPVDVLPGEMGFKRPDLF